MNLPIYELTISDNLDDDAEVNFVSLVDRPAIQKNWHAFNEKKLKFTLNEEKRIISGPIMLADTPIYRNDNNHGEYYVVFSKDTIFKIVQKYFRKGYQNNVNLSHDSNQIQDGITLFESFINDVERGIAPMKGYEDAPEGSWFGSMKVDNEHSWNLVKNGEVKGFSVEGIFEYSTKMSTEKDIVKAIKEILSQVK